MESTELLAEGGKSAVAGHRDFLNNESWLTDSTCMHRDRAKLEIKLLVGIFIQKIYPPLLKVPAGRNGRDKRAKKPQDYVPWKLMGKARR